MGVLEVEIFERRDNKHDNNNNMQHSALASTASTQCCTDNYMY